MKSPMAVFLVIASVASVVPAFGQGYYNRHNLTVSAGVGRPRGELRNLFADSFNANIEYGYRFHRNFQLDAGFDTTFGAAGVVDWVPTYFGDLRIRDYQHFIPFGGRVVLPLAEERVHIYGGLGGAYMRYTERVRQPFNNSGFQIPCAVCSARDGFGYYSTVGANAALDSGRHFRVGVGAKVYRGHTSGDPLGAVPPRETTDRWVNIYGTFSFTF
jgi:hypothetical protein